MIVGGMLFKHAKSIMIIHFRAMIKLHLAKKRPAKIANSYKILFLIIIDDLFVLPYTY